VTCSQYRIHNRATRVKLKYDGLRELGVDVDTTPVVQLHDSAEDVGNLFDSSLRWPVRRPAVAAHVSR